ncbi:ABC transporter ATP-binding protein, partial [Longispora fulva]
MTSVVRSVAARASDVWKVYGQGEAQVIALRGINVELAQ